MEDLTDPFSGHKKDGKDGKNDDELGFQGCPIFRHTHMTPKKKWLGGC